MPYLLALKVLLFTLVVPGTVTVYLPYLLVSGSATGLHLAPVIRLLPAGLLILLGLAVYVRCAWDFALEGLGTPAPLDPPKKLVINGLYRCNRNPMYQAVLLLLLGECLMFGSIDLLAYTGMVALIFQLFVVFYEEPLLTRQFGVCYLEYCAKVPRWGWAKRRFCSKSL